MNILTEKAVAAQGALKLYAWRAMKRFHDEGRDERGQASVEYIGIILVVAAIIAAIIAAGVTGVGTAIVTKLTAAVNKLNTA